MERSVDKCINCNNTLDALKTDEGFIKVLYSLTPLRYQVLLYRFIENKNYEQTAQVMFGRSYRERVRQLINEAIDHLVFRMNQLYGINITYYDIKDLILSHKDKLLWVIKREAYIVDEEGAQRNMREFNISIQTPSAESKKLGDLIRINEGLLHEDINFLELSTRASNLLRESGINTIRQLLLCSREDLLKIRFMGLGLVYQIIKALKNHSVMESTI